MRPTTTHATSCAGALGESPKDYIRSFIVLRAKSPILGGQSMSQVSEQLGFDYLQHLTRMFKQQAGQTSSEYLANQRKKINNTGEYTRRFLT